MRHELSLKNNYLSRINISPAFAGFKLDIVENKNSKNERGHKFMPEKENIEVRTLRKGKPHPGWDKVKGWWNDHVTIEVSDGVFTLEIDFNGKEGTTNPGSIPDTVSNVVDVLSNRQFYDFVKNIRQVYTTK
jgi:hypothetical protein